jgi:hypothetical protein
MGKTIKAVDAQTGQTLTKRLPDRLRSPSAAEIRKRIDARAAAFRKKHGVVKPTPMNYKEDERPSIIFIRDPASRSALTFDPEEVAKLFGARSRRKP